MTKLFKNQLAFKLAFDSVTTSLNNSNFTSFDGYETKNILKPTGQHSIDKEPAQKTRNIYLCNLDDTLVDWQRERQSNLWSLKRKFFHYPTDESIKKLCTPNSFLQLLEYNNIQTALITKHKMDSFTPKAINSAWANKFPKIFSFSSSHKHNRKFEHFKQLTSNIIKELLNETPTKNMRPVKIIYVGSKLTEDIQTANAIDKCLKQYNPQSYCNSVLFNSRSYQDRKVFDLPQKIAPKFIVRNYNEIESIAKLQFNIKQIQPATTITYDYKVEAKLKSEKPKDQHWTALVGSQQKNAEQQAASVR